MEIFDEEDKEIKQLMLRISREEITLCETCDTFFDYIPRKRFCDECKKAKKRKQSREYRQRPEVKEQERKRRREYYSRPEVKEQLREYYSRPEVKERKRKQAHERYHRLKKLREEE